MLKIDRLSTSYKTIHGDVRVVNNLDFTINDNEIFGIAGESGCGKSTLLKALYDIIDFPMQVDSGRVILSGEKEGNPFHFETGEIRKTWWNNISYVPQAAQSRAVKRSIAIMVFFISSFPFSIHFFAL